MPKVNTAKGLIQTVKFEEYKDKYKDCFFLERTESGVLTAK